MFYVTANTVQVIWETTMTLKCCFRNMAIILWSWYMRKTSANGFLPMTLKPIKHLYREQQSSQTNKACYSVESNPTIKQLSASTSQGILHVNKLQDIIQCMFIHHQSGLPTTPDNVTDCNNSQPKVGLLLLTTFNLQKCRPISVSIVRSKSYYHYIKF